jgi:hypothetical protein
MFSLYPKSEAACRTRSAVASLTRMAAALLWRTRETTTGVTPALAATSLTVTAIIFLPYNALSALIQRHIKSSITLYQKNANIFFRILFINGKSGQPIVLEP